MKSCNLEAWHKDFLALCDKWVKLLVVLKMEDDGYYSSPQCMICSCKEETLNNEAEWRKLVLQFLMTKLLKRIIV